MNHSNLTEKVLLAAACFLIAGIVLLNAFSAPVSPLVGVVYTNQETPEQSSSDYYAALASKSEESDIADSEAESTTNYEDLWEEPQPPSGDSPVPQKEASVSEETPVSSSQAPPQTESKPSTSSSSSKVPKMVNINTASVSELASSLPGIGEVKAQAIVNYRNTNGPFRSVDELINVKGIGEATLEKLRPYATVG